MRTSKVKTKHKGRKGSMTPSRLHAQQKRRTALEMRKAGASFDAIAQAVGYVDASGASKAVKRAMGDVIQEPVAELKVLQVERLNHMLVAIWTRVQQGDLGAMNMALSIMNKMDALQGTESAQRIEVNATSQSAVLVIDGSKDDYIAALRKMSGAGVQPDGTNAPVVVQQANVPALPTAPTPSRYPPGMSGGTPTTAAVAPDAATSALDVVDAVLVEDEEEPVLEEAPVPTTKKFSWDTTPKAKPRPKEER